VRRYAASESDRKPTYRSGDSPLPFSPDLRIAALDVMILTFAAKRHADWLAGLGECPADVAEQIQRHLAGIEQALASPDAGSPRVGDVGLRSQRSQSPTTDTTPLFRPTRANECNGVKTDEE